MTQKAKTLGSVIKAGSEFLSSKNIENPRLLCEMMASRLLGCKRLELPLQHDTILSEKQLDALRRGIKRLIQGEPVQYIIGETEFMGHRFKTDKRALIPRPETECLVQTIIDEEALWKNEKPVIAEIGTGSGCITISLALAQPKALYIAFDISDKAIELAKINAELNGVLGNAAFSNTELGDSADPESIDAVIANLPYIATDEYEALPAHIKNHELREALDGGPKGLSVIEPVIHDASFALKPGGLILLEIGETQASSVKGILEDAGFSNISTIKDLNGKDRIVKATLA